MSYYITLIIQIGSEAILSETLRFNAKGIFKKRYPLIGISLMY
jgi:hypothetical protein